MSNDRYIKRFGNLSTLLSATGGASYIIKLKVYFDQICELDNFTFWFFSI